MSRESLGLNGDSPIIMSGHQGELWHPGILAKRFAATKIANDRVGQAAWMVVDSDTNNGGVLAFPSRDADERPARREWAWLAKRGANEQGSPMCCRAAEHVAELPSSDLAWSSSHFQGLERARAALGASYRAGESAAKQLTRATSLLLDDDASSSAIRMAFASNLCQTPTFERLWNAMIDDPAGCVAAYNSAAAAFRGSGIRELGSAGGMLELPVWQIDRGVRRPVRIKARDDAARLNLHSLAPRALMLTATLRLGVCDLFIHGLGGEVYDRVMETWLRAWLPHVKDAELRSQELSPAIAVSATMRLEFEGAAVLTPEEIARRVWISHHAGHNPEWLEAEHATSEDSLQRTGATSKAAEVMRRKRALVALIDETKQRGDDARSQYRALHALLEEVRREEATPLDALRRQASEARSMTRLADIVHDRTWSFVLHDKSRLAALREDVERSVRACGSVCE